VTTLDLRPDELAADAAEPDGGDGKAAAPSAAPAVPRRRRTRTLSRQDILALVCSLLASFALIEIGYEHILDFSGLLGFLVCWYVTFMAVYALVLSVSNARVIVVERLVTATLYVIAAIVLFALGTAVVYVLAKGWHALVHLNFFTHDMSGVTPNAPLNQGGIYHAIVGTVIEVGIAVAISLPLGVVTAVYMTEVGGRGSQLVRTVVEAMTALPEILAGLFVYVILIVDFGLPKSGIAASVAMAVTMTPIIARASDVALRVVPGSLREASNALGAKHWRTVYRVVLPTARIGLSTALILAIARGIGETAIPLICSNASSFLTYSPFGTPMNSLPLYIYTMYSTHEPTAITRAFGAASVLLLMVLALFVVLRVLVRVRKVK
jgi:phosphate transport system permease protein